MLYSKKLDKFKIFYYNIYKRDLVKKGESNMAKVGLSKLGLKVDISVTPIKWNGQEIEIKNYLPVQEKLDLCARIINESVDDQSYYNPGRVAVYQVVEIVLAYTNISVTEKQKEDPCKLFDLFTSSGLIGQIYNHISSNELGAITNIVEGTIDNIYKYKNSALGIMQSIVEDYNNLDLEASEIQQKLADKDNLTLLKQVVTKLG